MLGVHAVHAHSATLTDDIGADESVSIRCAGPSIVSTVAADVDAEPDGSHSVADNVDDAASSERVVFAIGITHICHGGKSGGKYFDTMLLM